jgi:hypothetical protein
LGWFGKEFEKLIIYILREILFPMFLDLECFKTKWFLDALIAILERFALFNGIFGWERFGFSIGWFFVEEVSGWEIGSSFNWESFSWKECSSLKGKSFKWEEFSSFKDEYFSWEEFSSFNQFSYTLNEKM